MSDYDMSIHTNPDASAWVKFFRDCNPDCNVPDDLMLTWFANAMMAMHDHMRPDLAPIVHPDGSASCVVEIAGEPTSARIAALEGALEHYADQYCEGWCKDAPPQANFDDCGGCRARAALASTEAMKGE